MIAPAVEQGVGEETRLESTRPPETSVVGWDEGAVSSPPRRNPMVRGLVLGTRVVARGGSRRVTRRTGLRAWC